MPAASDERGQVTIPWNSRMHRLGIEVAVHRPAPSWMVEFGWSARDRARVANSPVVGVEPEKADSGYGPGVFPAPTSTAHGHGRVGVSDYLIQCRYDHGSKDDGPGRRCRQRWRPFRGPANTTPDIPASCNRSDPRSSRALAPVPLRRRVAGVGSTRAAVTADGREVLEFLCRTA